MIAKHYQHIEKKILKNSYHVITIAQDFNKIVENWNVESKRITVIPNWAPIKELPVRSKINTFSINEGLYNSFNVLYSGTLGMKHNPDIIYEAAMKLENNTNIKFIVITEGKGRRHLENRLQHKPLKNVVLKNFQSFDIFPDVLGTADCTLTLLEPEAGIFSVPSKVWASYCAQRPALLVVPEQNLAARVTNQQNAGIVVPPNSLHKLSDSILKLYEDRKLCERLGKNARKYAEENFHIETIASKFEKILNNN